MVAAMMASFVPSLKSILLVQGVQGIQVSQGKTKMPGGYVR
jgi:hypothetical protein